eukprot:TRINITY_DN458_c0_g1_i1.p1 TRINITY_DN458_c0_g1~~TRINITY_DN458_c0_g1_i1.p1  ORF type:complete len:355 (-),score=103.54 TRINITY_DN458_c0_g1_i1:26-1090(-)
MPRKKRSASSLTPPAPANGPATSNGKPAAATTASSAKPLSVTKADGPPPAKRANTKVTTHKNATPTKRTDPAIASIELLGYKVVPIQLGDEPSALRYLYYRQHLTKGTGDAPDEEEETPKDRTLFVTNLLFDQTEEDLLNIFGRFGPVESTTFKRLTGLQEDGVHVNDEGDENVVLFPKAEPGVFAHIVFDNADSVVAALAFDWATLTKPLHEEGEQRGVDKWIGDYLQMRQDPHTIMAQVDKFMYEFDKKQALLRQQEEEEAGKVDDDGFVMVRSKKGKKRVRDSDSGAVVGTVKAGVDITTRDKKKPKTLDDFYRYQRRENRRKQLADLRIQFEEDKKRIAKMRLQRKFKPF